MSLELAIGSWVFVSEKSDDEEKKSFGLSSPFLVKNKMGFEDCPRGGKVLYLLSCRSFYKGPDVLSTASQELFRVLGMELFKDCYHSYYKWRAVNLIGWTSCYHCTWRKRTGVNWISWIQSNKQMPVECETHLRKPEGLCPICCSSR